MTIRIGKLVLESEFLESLTKQDLESSVKQFQDLVDSFDDDSWGSEQYEYDDSWGSWEE